MQGPDTVKCQVQKLGVSLSCWRTNMPLCGYTCCWTSSHASVMVLQWSRQNTSHCLMSGWSCRVPNASYLVMCW